MCNFLEKPLISILMAVYEPNMDWFRSQLLSLNAQTYPNLRLYVRDDCSETVPYEAICAAVEECVEAFPCMVRRNSKNIGTTGTFGVLSDEADGEYFAYCDQDDIWMPEKIDTCYEELRRSASVMSYCAQSVIDGDGNCIADDLRKLRKRDVFFQGTGQGEKLFVQNCIYGCTTLIAAEIVRRALPVPDGINYDHWFSLWAAAKGCITRVEEKLIAYRLHGNNQSYSFRKIRSKNDYYRERIELLQRRVHSCEEHFSDNEQMLDYIRDVGKWANARGRWFYKDLNALPQVWKGRGYGKKATYFELALPFLTEKMFLRLIRILQN